MAEKDPAVLFYTSDFLAGTFSMNYTERGKYITLLCLQREHGRLSAKDFFKVCKKTDTGVIEKFEVDEDGRYYNRRMEAEIEKRKAHSNKQRENVLKRWNKNGNDTGNTVVLPLGNGNGNGNKNIASKEVGECREGEGKRFRPPTLEEVGAYCRERHNAVDPQAFIDFYASKGWKVGNQAMKDWKAAVRTWEQRKKMEQKGKNSFLLESIRRDYDGTRNEDVYLADVSIMD